MDWEEIDKELEDAIFKMQEKREETETFVKECLGYPNFENSVQLSDAVEAENMEAGAAPAEKYKETHAENTQHESIPIPGGKNILEESKKHKAVLEQEEKSNIVNCVLQSTKTASNRQVSTNWYFDTAINQGNVTIGNDNDCTSTNTDIRVTSNKLLRGAFVCDYCGNVFDDEHLLIQHNIQNHINDRKTSCGESSQQLIISRKHKFISRTGVVNKHTETHSIKELFECEICKVRFSWKCDLNRHSRVHTEEKPYGCDICKVRFRRKHHLIRHSRVHTGEKPYECDICKVRFRRKHHLIQHSRVHTREKPYECDICKVSFSQKNHLKIHSRIHTGEKPYGCDICKVSFTQKNHLKIHSRIHTGEKPYECDICKVSFNQKGHLKIHSRIHTGEKPYECDICKKRFTRKGHLNTHLRVHTSEKPYECDICKVNFNPYGHLKIHSRIHTGEKPYECDICKNRFSHKSSLRRHARIHTGER